MKSPPLFLFLTSVLILNACSKTQTPPEIFDPQAMTGMPCHQMGETWMGDCEFDEDGNVIQKTPEESSDSGKLFSQNTENLPEAKPSQIVEIKDGDTFKMTAEIVKQQVGNHTIKRLAYNGQIPGPLLKVSQGAEITLQLKNNLEIETTLHPHGLRLDNASDGVPGVTQNPIKPGESFTYTLKFPDAGLYWYHPHIREDYTQELGLYGNILVKPKDSNYWAPVDREENWILDDILLDKNQPAFDKDEIDHALMGRFGNVMLLNNEENFTLEAKKGETIRFYVSNVANTRVFNLEIPGVKTKRVGGDVGRIEKEILKDSFLIAPGERVIFEAEFNKEGRFEILHRTPEKTYAPGQIVVKGEIDSVGEFDNIRENPSDYTTVRSEMERWLAKAPEKSIRLSVSMAGMNHSGTMMHDDSGDGIEWEDTMSRMNRDSTSENTTWQAIDETTGKTNMAIDDWEFKKGDLVKIRIFNDPHSMHPMQHPIHFHGQRFVILSRNGVASDNLQWKDTALIKTGETVDLLVEMSNPGTWMAHCHIAEHLHSGMMWAFEIE